MKKFLKLSLSLCLAFICVVSFTACKKKVSETTVDTKKVASSNGVTTNGGVTVVYDGYLYFINGIKTNDGTSLSDNTRSAICRVKYDDGKIDESTYEVVVDKLVGFDDASLHFFGDYMYYAAPCNDVNKKDVVLYNKTSFMRYDLVNKKSYEVYTTSLNDEKETLSYAYYVVGDDLNLVVYEKNNKSITSLTIDKSVKTNYVIRDVESCVLSENYGKVVTKNASVDANSFIYFTKAHSSVEEDVVQTGNKVYKVLPTINSQSLIYDGGQSVSLLSIRNGKLIFACESKLYAQTITNATNEMLTLKTSNIIDHKYKTDASYMFIENTDGSISVLYYDSTAYNLNIITWKDGTLEPVTIQEFGKDDKFEFITTVTLVEEEEVQEGEDPVSHEVTYLIYINSKKLYKIEIALDGKYSESVFSEPIQLTKTEVTSATGLLVPEVIGDYIYIFAIGEKKQTYLHRTDVTIDVNVSELEDEKAQKATFIGIEDETDEKDTSSDDE